MTLSRKILLRTAAVFALLLLIGGASLTGMLMLWSSVQTASTEYEELRHVEVTEMAVLRAEALLIAPNGNHAEALREVEVALDSMTQFEALQAEGAEGSAKHEERESEAVEMALVTLRRIVAEARSGPLTPARRHAHLDELSNVHRSMRVLAGDADVLIASTQRKAYRYLKRGTAAVAGLFVVTAAVAAFISVQQYRGIMRPLRELRWAVRGMTRGDLSRRVHVHAEREFVELGEDFNRMARELDELYKTLEQKVRDRSRELVQSERLASVGFLAAGVAHEINNPLGIMSGYAELSLKRLRGQVDDNAIDDARRSLQIIRDEAQRCREITEKLLSLSRPGTRTRMAEVPLAGVIHDVVQMISAHASYSDRKISTVVEDADRLVVNASEPELKQVLLNLVVNALDATMPGGGWVRVEARGDREQVVVAISDNGHGMTPEVCERVFEPFFSARGGSPGRENRGTGLGLSITRAIVESYGGRIAASSDGPGRGSRFTVYLPTTTGRLPADAPQPEGVA
jgi:two-component system NtrC family sensor kinase